MTTAIIAVLITWTTISLIIFPALWIKIEPNHLRYLMLFTMIILLLPGILLWLMFLLIMKQMKEEVRNKILLKIENFYYIDVDN